MAARDVAPLIRWDVGSPIKSIALSNDSTRVVSGTDDGLVRIWDIRSGAIVLGPLRGHTDCVRSVAWSHDDTCIASASDDSTILIWDSRTGAFIGNPLIGHGLSVLFSANSTRIISGSKDYVIRIWDARTGASIGRPLQGHKHYVYSVAFSPDNTRIVSGSWDKTIRIWDARTGVPIGEPLMGHTSLVFSVLFSNDGTFIVSGSADKTIRMWDARTGAPIGEPLRGHTNTVLSVALSRTGTRIISGSADESIRIWDVRTGTSIGEPLRGHKAEVNSVAFSQDSSRIISGSADGSICVWKAPQSVSLNMVSSNTSDRGILEGLVEHGCFDISSSIDSSQFSFNPTDLQQPVDVRQARTNSGVRVVIRFLRLQSVQESGEKAVERLTHQLQQWSKAKHDNIQELLGVIMFQDLLGAVSPWVDNGTLQEYVRNNPAVDRYSLCTQVAKGVSYFHSIGIIHGDIRSRNVVISANGVAKLSGFDYSILFEDSLLLTHPDEIGPRTLRWTAPELLQKQEEDDPPVMRNKQTDVYALGMTMLEILTGRVPYSEYKLEVAIYGAIYRKELPQRPKELPKDEQKSSRMWELLCICWNHDASRRLDSEDIAPAIKVFVHRDS